MEAIFDREHLIFGVSYFSKLLVEATSNKEVTELTYFLTPVFIKSKVNAGCMIDPKERWLKEY